MKLLIFDGNSVLNRAFYGIRRLTNREGLYTNAVYGFTNIYLKFMEDEKPDYVCVAFDLPGATIRHKKYEKYKANRKGMPDELAIQLPLVKELLERMGVTMLTCPSYEGDDIIGTVAKKCEDKGCNCVIVTGDRDSLQLVSDLVTVKLVRTKGGATTTDEVTPSVFFEKHKFSPPGVVELKALMGDSSDNIPGVAGVGKVTASALIRKYNNIDEIYNNLETLPERESVKKKLAAGREMAYKSRELARIICDIPIEFDFEQCRPKPYDKEKLLPVLNRLGFNTIISRLGFEEDIKEEENKVSVYPMSCTDETYRKIETAGELYYLLHDKGMFFCLDKKVCALSADDEEYVNFLKRIMENGDIKKHTHDVKEDIVKLYKMGIELEGYVFCTMVAGYIADSSWAGYEPHTLTEKYLNKGLFGKQGDEEYFAAFCFLLPQLEGELKSKIEERSQQQLLYEVELPLCKVLAFMQIYGFKVERQRLSDFGKKLNDGIEICQHGIFSLAGKEFNINSPKQLGTVLFEDLGLPPVRKTKTGYSTSIDVLEKLAPHHEIVSLIIEYRHLTKLKSTYVDGLMKVIDSQTGRIHSSFNQTVTQTGRISSTEPNLQNIPVRMELGREIRKVFVCENEDYVLVDADYSQIELRILAHIADDKVMQKAFADGEDIHRITASEVFGVEPEQVTPMMRSQAKAVNFGIVYGIGDYSLSQDLKISRKEARKYIDTYLETYKGVREYMKNVVVDAKEKGYVETLLHRRRYLPELSSKNAAIRKFGERCAMNTPIQGTAADIIKIAMVNVFNRLKAEKLCSRLILQVHDELIVEAKKSELSGVKNILKEEMENVLSLKVKLVADMHEGESWYTAKG